MSDSWIDWNPRIEEPSKAKPVLEHVLVEDVNRNCEVLHGAWQVTEADVDILDVLVLGEFEDVVGRLFGHRMLLCLVFAGGVNVTDNSRRTSTTPDRPRQWYDFSRE